MSERYDRYKQRQASLEAELSAFFNSKGSGSFPLARDFSLEKEKECKGCFVYWKSQRLGKISAVNLTAAELHLVKDFVVCKYDFIVDLLFQARLKKVCPDKNFFFGNINISLADLVTTIISLYDRTLEFYSDELFNIEVPDNPF